MPHYRIVALVAWITFAVIEQILVGLAIIASLGALVLLVVAFIWGRRLWRAVHEHDSRLTEIESTVYGEG